jgi:hypothetical protein
MAGKKTSGVSSDASARDSKSVNRFLTLGPGAAPSTSIRARPGQEGPTQNQKRNRPLLVAYPRGLSRQYAPPPLVAVQLFYAMNEYLGQVQGCVGLWHSPCCQLFHTWTVKARALSGCDRASGSTPVASDPVQGPKQGGAGYSPASTPWAMARYLKRLTRVAAVVLSAVWSARAAQQTDEQPGATAAYRAV